MGAEPHLRDFPLEDLRQSAALAGRTCHYHPVRGGLAWASRRAALLDDCLARSAHFSRRSFNSLSVLAARLSSGNKGGVGEVFCRISERGAGRSLNLVFLPHQTLLAIDAIVRALVRRFITGERLLEWETAAQAEYRSDEARTPVDRYLALTPLVAVGIGVTGLFRQDRTATRFWWPRQFFCSGPAPAASPAG